MSRFEELMEITKAELVSIAEEYDLDQSGNKGDIANRIIDFEMGATVAQPIEEEPEEEPEPVLPGVDYNPTLVRFTGKNSLYSIRGKVYTQKNPFQVVSKSDADYLVLNKSKHFRFATEREVQEYYS
jgi:hypothetical protein